MTSLRRIGVDTGGTFTDCVLVDYARQEVRIAKVPSRPGAPHAAILDAVDGLAGGESAPVESLTHGTTIATNAVIQNDLARVGLVTTRGFRDTLEIGTQMRPKLYDLRLRRAPAMIPRQLRCEVGGRIDATGAEVEPLDEAEVAAVARALLDAGVEAVAVACLFSFANPDHERRIQAIVQRLAPDLYVGRSSRISQEPREYPRVATAAVNAALAPRLDPYVRGLEAGLAERPHRARLFVMQSSGGIATAERSVGEGAHQLLLSGPAAGVIGGAREGRAAGFPTCVTFDVGGTSADIGVVTDGAPRTAVEMTLPNGVPCRVAHIEVVTIGAGGGSIAWVDAGGALHVGPQSAGAEPGPACYGRGGEDPTVTDAHLVLGRLSPAGLAGGDVALDEGLARAALGRLARRLGTSLEDAALGILAVMEENMAGAIRGAAARHGDDLRDHALVAGGGAGALHAAMLLGTLGMRAAVVPQHPGLLSALGLLAAHIRHDLVAPVLGLEGEMTDATVDEVFAALERDARDVLLRDGVADEDHRLERTLDLRYFGQEYTLQVPVADGDGLAAVVARFHELHARTFGHAAPDVRTEVVAARVVALGLRAMPELPRRLPCEPGAPRTYRPVAFAGEPDARRTAIHDRGELAAGQVVAGPAVVEQLDATTLVPPGHEAAVHATGALVIRPGSRT